MCLPFGKHKEKSFENIVKMTSTGPSTASTNAEKQPELTNERNILVSFLELGFSKTMTHKQKKIFAEILRIVKSKTLTLKQKYTELRKYVHGLSIFTPKHPVTPNHPVSNLKLTKRKVSKKPNLLQFSCLVIGDVTISPERKPIVINNGNVYHLETC